MGFRKGMAAFGGGILFTFLFVISWFMRISKTTKQTIHHVLSYFITSHLNQVIRRIPNLTETGGLSMGFRKGMAAFGGGILFTCFFWSFLGLYIYIGYRKG